MARRVVKKASKAVIGVIVTIVALCSAVYAEYNYNFIGIFEDNSLPSYSIVDGIFEEFSIHFFDLGNDYAGDCILIDMGDTEILVDSGSRTSSTETTIPYINHYCTDGKLEYAIATHADQDHISGFFSTTSYTGIFETYEVGTIIDFAKSNKTSETYVNYLKARNEEISAGATHYTALECWNETNGAKRDIAITEDVTMHILYNYYYEHTDDDENNYSVCFYLSYGGNNYMFTGDLEKEGEEYLVEKNELPECVFYKVGHHGSKTSSTEDFMSAIKPGIAVVPCCAGTDEYKPNDPADRFPTQSFIDNIAPYTDAVYVPSVVADNDAGYDMLNGTIVVSSDGENVAVNCSKSNDKLKDTDWFKENRTCPTAWQ